jgi:hypothetical protein
MTTAKRLVFLVAASLLAPACLAQTNVQDAATLEEAQALALTNLEHTSALVAACAEKVPEKAAYLHRALVFWKINNMDEFEAARLGNRPAAAQGSKNAPADSKSRAEQTLASKVSAVQFCNNYASSLIDGSRSMRKETPKASKFLVDSLAPPHPDFWSDERRNFVRSCQKRLFNEQASDDLIENACPCAWEKMRAHWKPDDYRQYLSQLADKTGQKVAEYQEFWQSCSSKAPASTQPATR